LAVVGDHLSRRRTDRSTKEAHVLRVVVEQVEVTDSALPAAGRRFDASVRPCPDLGQAGVLTDRLGAGEAQL